MMLTRDAFKALHPLRPDTALSLEIVPALAKSINANAVKGRTFLPHDVPKDAEAVRETIAVIVEEGPDAETARRMGADHVGTEELITQVRCSPPPLGDLLELKGVSADD